MQAGLARPSRPPPRAAHLSAHSRPSSSAPGCVRHHAGAHRAPPAAPLWPRAASGRSHPACCGPGRSYRRTELHPGCKSLNRNLIKFIPFSNPNKNRWSGALIQDRIGLESLCITSGAFPYINTFPDSRFAHTKNRATTLSLPPPSPSWSRAAWAPPSGQGGPS
jgi:hypothetical protein